MSQAPTPVVLREDTGTTTIGTTTTNPLRVDPSGTTVQPVSSVSAGSTGATAPSSADQEGLLANVGATLPSAVMIWGSSEGGLETYLSK